jgi:hypothetical protein
VSKLPELAALTWRAYGEGRVSEAEAASIVSLIEERKALAQENRTAGPAPVGAALRKSSIFPPKRRAQPRPDRAVVIERRREMVRSGWLPPKVAAKFTWSEQAVLSVVAREIAQKSACELAVDAIAALAGTSRRTVQNALRIAHDIALVHIEERPRQGRKNLTNRVTMLDRAWKAWAARRGTGCRNFRPMSTRDQNQRPAKSSERPISALRGSEDGDRSAGMPHRSPGLARGGIRGAEAG